MRLSCCVTLILYSVSAGFGAEKDNATETRPQAILGMTGDMLPDGMGLKVATVRANGPAAKLTSAAKANIPGILDRGDVITAVDGKAFASWRKYFDLLNDSNRKTKGKVRLTVLDISSGRTVDWIVAPEIAQMDVPPAHQTFEEFAAIVHKAIQDGRFVVQPHRFTDAGYWGGGGLEGADAEEEQNSPFMIPVDTLCLLEAKIHAPEWSKEKRKKLDKGCRKKIETIVKEQLDLIANHKGTPEELKEELRKKQMEAVEKFLSTAKDIGLECRAIQGANDNRLTITFALDPPKGASVFYMNAGQYELSQSWPNYEPRWIPAGKSERFGFNCQYVIYAKWDNGETSEVKPIHVIADATEELKPAPSKAKRREAP
jgi:hypothetical protein